MKRTIENLVFKFIALASLIGYTGYAFQLFGQSLQPTPADARLKSLQQKRAMTSSSSINIAFRNIGPSAMSGRVVDVDVNPDKPTEFYVAYATGGLWYTNNNGQSFKPIFDSCEVIGLGDVTVHWPTRTIWVGTGEANASRSTYSGVGVYKSTNNGKTWRYVGLPESHHIGRIVLHPTDTAIAWVAATGHLYSANSDRGVYKTSNGGASWKKVLYVNDMTGAIDMAVNSGNVNELYACMWQKDRKAWNFEEAGAGSGIYKSVDGGEHWQLISGRGSGLPDSGQMGRCGIAIAPTNPNLLYLLVDRQLKSSISAPRDTLSVATPKYRTYHFRKITREQFAQLDENKLDTFLAEQHLLPKYNALQLKAWVASGKIAPNELYKYIIGIDGAIDDFSVSSVALFKSADAGKSWELVNNRGIQNGFGPIGYYFGRLVVSPVNDQKVLLLGIQPLLSTDGGKNVKGIAKQNVHVDFHAAWINPKDDQHIIVGNDGGINITYDDGGTWFKANMPAVGQIYSLSVDNSKPYQVYAGLQDNGVWYGPTRTSGSNPDFADPNGFRMLGGGDGMMVLADPRDNKTIYLGSQFGTYSRTHLDTGGLLPLKPMHNLGEAPFRFNWLSPIMISRHLPDAFYLAGNRLHRSLNKGAEMQTISADLTNGERKGDVPYGTITTIDESPLRFGLLYAGTDDGNVQVSTDGGYNWQRIDAGLPKGLWVSRVVASAFKESRVYITLNGYRNDHFNPYIFVSEDFGTSWKPLHAQLPLEPVNVLKEDPLNENILYLGTDGGCYVSKNKGQSWNVWNKGLPVSIPVHDIAIHRGQNQILLGTHGRSIYLAQLDNINGGKAEKIVVQERKPED